MTKATHPQEPAVPLKGKPGGNKNPRRRSRIDRATTRTDPETRRRMIAEAAYYKSQARDFAPGFEELDWLAAEREIDARLR